MAFLPVVLVTLEVLQCGTLLPSESNDWDRSGGGEKEMQNEHGGWERAGWGEIATHNSPPERPCCCYRRRWRRSRRRKVGRTAAVSLVTKGGEIMKWRDERKHLAPLRAFTVEGWRKGRGRGKLESHLPASYICGMKQFFLGRLEKKKHTVFDLLVNELKMILRRQSESTVWSWLA